MGATAAGSPRDESWSVRHAGRNERPPGKQRDGPGRWISRSCFVFETARQESSDGTVAMRASRMLDQYNEAERAFVAHVRHLQITYSRQSSDEVQLCRQARRSERRRSAAWSHTDHGFIFLLRAKSPPFSSEVFLFPQT